MDDFVQIEISVTLAVEAYEDGFVSSCPSLDLFSQGDTEGEALENISDAIRLFVASCCERGTLYEVLRDRGVHKGGQNPMAQPSASAAVFPRRRIPVPLPLEPHGPSSTVHA